MVGGDRSLELGPVVSEAPTKRCECRLSRTCLPCGINPPSQNPIRLLAR
jgi:hypothetical protein